MIQFSSFAQLCLTLCDPVDYSLPVSSVHGILQARILECRDGVSREVPCSALKGESVPDSLPATPKSPPTRRVPPRVSLSGHLHYLFR